MQDDREHDHTPPYRHVAWAYDAIASAYSLGAIDRAKAYHHGLIESGMRVLYAGAGRGREIAGVLARGAEVTCVEPCPSMAMRLHNRLALHGERFTIVPRWIQDVNVSAEFDLVIAHFFLNVFDNNAMQHVLEHLCSFVKPGGRLVIADFKPDTQSDVQLTRLLRWAYYRPVNLAGWLLRICALHPVYDYGPLLKDCGMDMAGRQPFRVAPARPALYEVITARKP